MILKFKFLMRGIKLTYPCFLLMLLTGLAVLYSCKQHDQPSPEALGYDYNYFPLKVGSYIIYDVHQVVYEASKDSIVKRFQEKYVIADTINGSNINDNRSGWVYARYRRGYDTLDWQPDSIWNIRYSTGKQALVVTENNVPLVKLFYPLKNNLTWNGNGQNMFGGLPATPDDLYKITDYQKAFAVGGNVFNNTITVEQHRFADCTKKDIRKEVYAYELGMVYRIIQEYQYPQYSPADPDYCNHLIASGWFKELKYNSHGQE